jgi:transposase-like protein
VLKFGPLIARRLHRCHPPPSNRWHVDEMVVRIHSREKPRFSTSARYFP